MNKFIEILKANKAKKMGKLIKKDEPIEVVKPKRKKKDAKGTDTE